MEVAASASLDVHHDSRIQDYLDDKIQQLADLDTLGDLLANVETQRNQLQAQLEDAVKELEDARHTAKTRHASLAERIASFRELQESIDERVKIAAASEAPSEAIARLQSRMRKLQSIDLAQRYFLLLQDLETLRKDASQQLPADCRAALEPYFKLRETFRTLKGVPDAEGLHLVAYASKKTEQLYEEMKRILSEALEFILQKKHWPRVDLGSEIDADWISCIELLIDLQIPEIAESTDVVSFVFFDIMASIFVAEFRFHFLSDKPTSDIAAVGSHCFPWFLATIEKWDGFFRYNLSHLLAEKLRDTPIASNMVYLDPTCAFITSMLPVMREKVRAVAREAKKTPQLFSGFVAQLLAFDDNVRSMFDYDGGDPERGWAGVAADLLDKEQFEAWFRMEKVMALERLEKILESQEARKIDSNYAVTGMMKPTFAAVAVTDLLRSVTAKYERLRRLKYKTRFLIDIQLDILDAFHDRLRGSLEAYQSLTSALGRTLHGATKEQIAALEGTGALETLCKVVGSADHVAHTLMEWSDEEFFAVLWEELQERDQRRAQGHVSIDANVAGDVDKRLPDRADGGAGSGIFDETVAAFMMRRGAAEDLLRDALTESHHKAFRAYVEHVQWSTVGESAILDDPSQMSISPELDEPLRVLSRNLDYLSQVLSTASFRRVWYDALGRLQDTLFQSVLLRQSFTTLGAAQFAHDVAALGSLVDRYLPCGSSTLEALREGLELLNLPAASVEEEGEACALTLKEASDRAFTDNEARKVLEELRLEALTPSNARYILQRRVENKENIGW